MNYLKFSSKILFSLSFLFTFYFSANVLTEADYLKGQRMKNGEEVSSTKYKNERLIFKGSPKQLNVETKNINIKYKYKKDSNGIIKDGASKKSNNFIDFKTIDLPNKSNNVMFKSIYGTNYLPFESQDNNTRNCADCQYDFTEYGSECCDSAWDEYGLTCAELEGGYGWNCEGCSCPGDNAGGNDCNDCLAGCIDANTSEYCQNLDCPYWTPACQACTEELLTATQACQTNTAAQGGCAEACGNVVDPDDCEDENISGNVSGYQYESCADLVNWLSNVAGYDGSACDVMWGGSPVNIMCPETCGLCNDDGDDGCTDDDSDGICDDEDDCVGLTVNMYNSNIWISNGWEGLELSIGNQSFTMTDEDTNGVDTACYTGCTSNAYVSMDMGCSWACDNYSWEILSPDGTVLLAGGWPYPIGPDEGYLNYGDDDCSDDDTGCNDGYWDCGDGQCIAQGYVCDGSTEFGNAYWPADCDNGADETLEDCCDSPDYANVEACEGGDDDGGDDGGDDNAPTCEDNWDSCLQSLLAIGSEYYDACSAEDCQGGAGGECDGSVVPGLTDECGYAASNIANGTCPDPCGGGTDTGCPDNTLPDCADDDCAPSNWVGDGYCDGTTQQYGANLCCYDLDGGDCTAAQCAAPSCGDGACNGTEDLDSCPEDCTPSTECDDCQFDFTSYGSECCDTAWVDFGIDCATLVANYSWDCTGCECPGDDPTLTCEDQGLWDCGDGQCINPDYVCDGSTEFCNASWDADCANGADEGLDACGYEDECDDDGGDDLPRPGDNCTGDPDEHVCPTLDFFGYVSGGECVPAEQVCDGVIDCYYYDGPFSQVHDETEFAGCSDDGGGDDNTCEDEAACNTGAEGDCTYADAGYDCDGYIADGYHVDCAGNVADDYYLSFIGDGWCDGVDEAYGVNYQCCEFNFDDGDCGDALGCGGIAEGCEGSEADACGNCDGDGTGGTGDLNVDCDINVLDVITLVYAIVDATDLEGGDLNGDGSINVADAVALVNIILGSGRVADATSASMILEDNSVSITADGYIGGVQMTLSHDNGFELNLTDNAMVAEYKTSGTSTILVVVEPNDELIFTTNQSFEIVEMIVANSNDEIEVNTISEFGLSTAYPNPFNPSTSVSLTVPSADYVSVKVYNLMGQMVGTLAEGMMEASVYTFTWDASDMSSGVYLIKAESSSSVDIQKVLLVK